MTDLLSEAGARLWLESVKRQTRERFVEDGSLPPAAVFITTRDERNGKKLPEGGLIYVGILGSIVNDHGPYGQKDQLSSYLRRMARKVDAVGFAFWSEAWLLHGSGPKPEGSWENVPGRLEVVKLTVQHKALGEGTMSFDAVIEKRRKGRRVLLPWGPEGRSHGRFSDVLRSAKEDAQIAQMMPVLLAMGERIPPEERRHRLENVRRRLVEDGHTQVDADWMIRAFIELLREHGQEIPDLPGEQPVPPATDDPIKVVNLDEEAPIVGRGKA